MRELTSFSNKAEAGRLAAYLAVQAVESSVDADNDQWTVWVRNDDDRDKAIEILKDYQQDPKDPKFEMAERKVRSVLREADRMQQEALKKQNLVQKRKSGSWWHCYPATYTMIGICIAVAVACTELWPLKFGEIGPLLCNNRQSALLNKLGVQTPAQFIERDGVRVAYYHLIPEFPKQNLTLQVVATNLKDKAVATTEALKWTMSNGEVWRPVTPIFIHLSVLHILFNMMWLRVMGTAIEFRRGTGRFVILCLIIAVTSNIAQLFWGGPFFGGMSGVVFGLIGYVWMKGKTQPSLGMGLHQQTVVYCILWLVLCMTGALGPIANAAHLMGFLVGILIGARQAIWKKIPFVT